MSSTRREFLKASLGASALLSLGSAAPEFLSRTARAAAGPSDGERILVVLQLAGGNDGLNTVVPHGDDEYPKVRRTLRIPTERLHKIDSLLGFHPELGAMMKLYQDGYLSVVQGVGYPNPDGDHNTSMRIWQTGTMKDSGCQTGWLGRLADHVCGEDDARTPIVYLGEIPRPFTLNARRSIVPAIHAAGDLTAKTLTDAAGSPAHRRRLARAAEAARPGDNPLLDMARRGALAAYAKSNKIEAAGVLRSASGAVYPPYQLAQSLRTVAGLIRADLGLRIYYTELGGDEPGGFDNHANQRDNHAALLRQLSESVAAFVRDLERDKLLDWVLVMTFSEFGRTVRENGRRGTDHGSAAPLFLAGGKVKGGLIGAHPNLTDLEGGGQKHHTDFRRVYATVLDRWLGYDSQAVLGARYEPLDVLKA
ncbi:MAG: DUF1501 domain-containing protein [Pirellulales bacterium]